MASTRSSRRWVAASLPDVYKDIWGHLPEKMRQEMDLYYREQFIPRYSELLKQYYSLAHGAAAEKRRICPEQLKV